MKWILFKDSFSWTHWNIHNTWVSHVTIIKYVTNSMRCDKYNYVYPVHLNMFMIRIVPFDCIWCILFTDGSVMIGGVFPVLAIVAAVSAVIAGFTYYATLPDLVPRFHTAFAYIGFGVSVVWIYCIATEIVVLLQVSYQHFLCSG